MADPKKGSNRRTESSSSHQVTKGTSLRSPPSARWEGEEEPWKAPKGDLGSTVRMGSAPSRPPRAPLPRLSEPPRARAGSQRGIELVVVDETQGPAGERRPWRAAEVWTKRRVYGLDSTFKCVEILDRETGKPESGHEMIGARLGGGRLREKEAVRFSYPLPVPGMEAMFTKNKKHGYTSPVERVIVRVRLLHTSADEAMPSWDEIASRWSDMPPKP